MCGLIGGDTAAAKENRLRGTLASWRTFKDGKDVGNKAGAYAARVGLSRGRAESLPMYCILAWPAANRVITGDAFWPTV